MLKRELVYDEFDEREWKKNKSHEKHWKFIFAGMGCLTDNFPLLRSSSSTKLQLRGRNYFQCEKRFLSVICDFDDFRDIWQWKKNWKQLKNDLASLFTRH